LEGLSRTREHIESQVRVARERLFVACTPPMQRVGSLFGGQRDLRVRWSNAWDEVAEAAQLALPPMPCCSRDLYRALAQNPCSTDKRVAVVFKGGEPTAVVALRRRQLHWELVTDSVVPWCLFPAREGEHARALAALNIPLRLVLDREPDALGPQEWQPYEFFRADLRANYEKHWRDAGHHNSVRQARNKTNTLTVAVDRSGDIRRVTSGWASTWSEDPEQESTSAPDRILAGEALASEGRFHVVTLLDGDHCVAGSTFYVHEDAVILQTVYRELARTKQGVGTRVQDAAFQWAAEAGYRWMDLGGGGSYKGRWAPAHGSRYMAHWTPAVLRVLKQGGQLLKRLVAVALLFLPEGALQAGVTCLGGS
jgi:hypothetical protein